MKPFFWGVLLAVILLNTHIVHRTDVRWYDRKSAPTQITANGEWFNDKLNTFASRDLPFNTLVTVDWRGKMITVRCNDRGPNHIELTKGAFQRLEDTNKGVLRGAIYTYDN